jgi:hypothetical protein
LKAQFCIFNIDVCLGSSTAAAAAAAAKRQQHTRPAATVNKPCGTNGSTAFVVGGVAHMYREPTRGSDCVQLKRAWLHYHL